MSTERIDGLIYGASAALVVVVLMWAAHADGYAAGRQSMPIACEPKCTFTYRAGKLINVTCPDSTGAMP